MERVAANCRKIASKERLSGKKSRHKRPKIPNYSDVFQFFTDDYIKVKGRWTYLYRAIDKCGQTIDLLLSAQRDAAAAKRYLPKALGQPREPAYDHRG